MSLLVYLSDTARAHFFELDDYWRSDNPSNAELFQDELDQALKRISAFPNAGMAHPDRPGVRQTLLRKTSCYVYYQQDIVSNVLEVLAIWSTRRGDAPPL